MPSSQLHGIFAATGPAGLNLEPDAFAHYRKPGAAPGSPFPAQIKWRWLKKRPTGMKEAQWQHIPKSNVGRGGKKQYDYVLSAEQAIALARLF